MFRWSLRIFTLFSFFLFAESLALWVRSYVLVDFVHHEHLTRSGRTVAWDSRMATSHRGGINLATKHSVWTLPHPELSEQQIASIHNGWHHEQILEINSNTLTMKQPSKFGFGREKIVTKSNGMTTGGWIIVFPWAAPALLFAILPFIGVVRFMQARRRIRRLKALNWNGIQTRKLAA
ncbi:MAG TPA: hypothetical protein VGP99_06145 [Tepidisphaeraceae bacterium]|jgi:hypothetical protein|nr:hypothetical protein [Tepidisphaeraceae bacterium]